MIFFDGTANQVVTPFVEAGLIVASLLLILIGRIWLYYHFQVRAMENAAPRIRRALCAHLYAGKEYRLPFRQEARTDLQMIFDLSKWRYRDFFPQFLEEEENW